MKRPRGFHSVHPRIHFQWLQEYNLQKVPLHLFTTVVVHSLPRELRFTSEHACIGFCYKQSKKEARESKSLMKLLAEFQGVTCVPAQSSFPYRLFIVCSHKPITFF